MKFRESMQGNRDKGWSRLPSSRVALSLLICLVVVFRMRPTIHTSESNALQQEDTSSRTGCADPHYMPDGGDCQALHNQNRRPNWACFSEMRTGLEEFLLVYRDRPVKNNAGGMRFDHSFALWYSLRSIRPTPETVIESGAFKGHGTWIIRQALPHARIFSLDPREPQSRLKGVEYMVGKDFVDLATVDWKTKRVNPETAVLFIDDHQSGYRRTLLEMRPKGFFRFLIEDNYPFKSGDNYSFKWVCELHRQAEWPGAVNDNFARSKIDLMWEGHLKHASYLPKILKTYYEFPPVASSELSGQTRFDPQYTSMPIVTDRGFFEESGLAALAADELAGYTHFAYVELQQNITEVPPPLSDSR